MAKGLLTTEEFRALQEQDSQKGRSKYRSRRAISRDGNTFPSQKERNRYEELCALAKIGIIKDLELQPSYRMVINDRKVCDYRADFRYTEDGRTVVEDVKGFKTPVYRLKKKLMMALYNIEILET